MYQKVFLYIKLGEVLIILLEFGILLKKISLVGGSLRDIKMMVGHSSLQTTQRYIEADSQSQRKVIDLI